MGIFQVEPIAAAAVREAVDREEAVRKDVVQDDVAEAAAAVVEGVAVGEWGVAEGDEALQGGGVGGGHGVGMSSRFAIVAMVVSGSGRDGVVPRDRKWLERVVEHGGTVCSTLASWLASSSLAHGLRTPGSCRQASRQQYR